jgi:tRNA A37 threonylcarbamoyladenosine dehydratase
MPAEAGAAERVDAPDLERRFGALRRLYGDAAYLRLRSARVAVVGLGGVGSWVAEALARSGVAALTLIDLDHVAESNINRQVQALGSTLGMAKATALGLRVQDINPACMATLVEEFVDAANWPALLGEPVDAVIDACDQVRAKLALANWARTAGVPLIVCGAAGGKRVPQAVTVNDLADVTHDRLLASLRQQLRKSDPAARTGRLGLTCVHSREPVYRPASTGEECAPDGSLNCHGYGSSVAVTATFGMVAAAEVLRLLVAASP